jgi:hemolysin III
VRINKDPWSAYTHFAGFLAGIGGLVVLLYLSRGDGPKTVGMALFGVTLIGMFGSSAAYHFFDLGERGNTLMRRVDHSAIFLFIAGSYITPLIHTLDGAWRISMLSVISGIAVAGVLFKIVWITAPRWLTAGIYVAMGWVVVIPGPMVVTRLPVDALIWVVIGGLAYTIGAVIYARKHPDPMPGRFGFHEVFHVFVMVGAGSHFLFMLSLVDQPYTPFGG